MKKIFSLIMAVLVLAAALPGTAAAVVLGPINADITINSVTSELVFGAAYSGVITIGTGAHSVKISMDPTITDEEIAATTGASIVIAAGRTELLEFTVENLRFKTPEGRPGIDFGDAGNYPHTLYIIGTNEFSGSQGKAGIHVPAGVQLTISKAASVTDDTQARLTAAGGRYGAGIGGNLDESGGVININSGTVTASSQDFGAGIGGGSNSGPGGIISISGGIVTAAGGIYGAAIGGGWTGTGGVINISGGTVTAIGSYGGAGIGGGRESYAELPGEGDGGIINISGGTVTATNSNVGAAIGGGWGGSAGNITISGGTVNATGLGDAGIGNGSEGTGGVINLTGGTIIASGGGAGIGGSGSGSVGIINITGAAITATSTIGGAGIGGGHGESGGTINIGGGTITAISQNQGAGIGGGSGGSSGNINITGGVLNATGSSGGAGIGGGYRGAGDTISISGGTLTVAGSYTAAGIGGGGDDQDIGRDGGNIAISGGTINVSSVGYGAGIGGGNKGNGGIITINGGSVTVRSGDGTSYDNNGSGGAGIGGGNGGNGGTITINAGIVNATGDFSGAGIGGGSTGAGGTVTISGGTVEAAGGGNGAGVGGGWRGAGGIVTISGGNVSATGGHAAAGIGGGYGGAGGSVIITDTSAVIAAGDAEDGAQHIGKGTDWFDELDSGTLKDGSGNDLSYLVFHAEVETGVALHDAQIRLEGTDTVYMTDGQGDYRAFVHPGESGIYSYMVSKTGYAAAKGQGSYSTSHHFAAQMPLDNTPPAISINPVTSWEADVSCPNYGVYGTVYFVPEPEVDYTSKAALDFVANGRKFYINSPQTTVRIDALGLHTGKYQIYAADSADNVSLPSDVTLPFEVNFDYSSILSDTITIVEGTPVIRSIPSLNTNTGTYGFSISTATLNKAFSSSAADESGLQTIAVDIPKSQGVNAYEAGLPINALSGDPGRAVEIRTELADITVPSNMLLQETAGSMTSASLIIRKADTGKLSAEIQSQIGSRPVIELSLLLDGRITAWDNPDAPVTVTIPYEPTPEELKDPEHITVWYIDSDGNAQSVPSGRYDPKTGRVTFITTHFSCYAVAYVQKTFSDMSGFSWAENQIEVLASKGIINGTSKDTFSPAAGITRADYLVLLVKTLGLTASFDSNFSDVEKGTYYYEAAGIAKKLGITNGTGNSGFSPEEYITRQDMMTLAARTLERFRDFELKAPAAVLDKFKDRSDIAGYAVDCVAALANEKLITGQEGGLNPLFRATRAEAAVFLYRIYNRY
ncbi:MAG: S-layer homology domain-containing protein [Clostridiaceae bacterium]